MTQTSKRVQFKAACYGSGEIVFTNGPLPNGALPLVLEGTEQEIRDAVCGNARLAYDNETYLVPGIPEASDQTEALDAMLVFTDRVAVAIARNRQLAKAEGSDR